MDSGSSIYQFLNVGNINTLMLPLSPACGDGEGERTSGHEARLVKKKKCICTEF